MNKERLAKHMKTKRGRWLTILTAVFVGLGLLYFIYWLAWGRFYIYTDDAYANGNMVQLMSQVPGTVVAINTDNTQLVKEGDVLIRLDPSDMEIALQNAEANLGQTVRQVKQYFENAKQAQAELILRDADLKKAKLDLARREGLVAQKAISREELQHINTAYQTAQASYDLAKHQLGAALALVQNSQLYSHPLVERAKADFKRAYLNLKRTVVIAPVTGYVAKRSVQVGQQIALNTPMLAIIPLDQVWVDANYKESELNPIRIDQPVKIKSDAYDFTYHGKVEGLTPGTGSAFALLPPQNATGNWIKIVQRLPVRIALDPKELAEHPLQLGLSMYVTINAHDTSGRRLAKKPLNKTVFKTEVFADQLAEVNRFITEILQENAADIAAPSAPTTETA